MLGETSETLAKFKAALKQNGAEFPVSIVDKKARKMRCYGLFLYSA